MIDHYTTTRKMCGGYYALDWKRDNATGESEIVSTTYKGGPYTKMRNMASVVACVATIATLWAMCL